MFHSLFLGLATIIYEIYVTYISQWVHTRNTLVSKHRNREVIVKQTTVLTGNCLVMRRIFVAKEF